MAENSGGQESTAEDKNNKEREISLVKSKKKRFSIDEGECCINRIDKLSEKIADLSGWLDDFRPARIDSDLVFNKYVSDVQISFDRTKENGQFSNEFSKCDIRDTSPGKEAKNSKDLEKFAGMYSVKMVFSPDSSVSPELSRKSFRKMKSKLDVSESSSNLNKRPMLVELHSYPGYDQDEITPLPSPVHIHDMLKIVTSAQADLDRKPTFKQEFKRFYFSCLSKAILSDTFWWFFCKRYQPTPSSQEKLFNRISHNYTKLLIHWIGSKYHNTLFKRYPDLLAQSVYATFCRTFPTSYRQFDDDFKDDLIYVVSQWVTGTHPAPRTFEKWNLLGLEPKDMRKGDELYLNSSNKSKKQDVIMLLSDEPFDQLNQAESKKMIGISQISSKAKTRRTSRANNQSITKQTNKKTTLHLPVINEPDQRSFDRQNLDLNASLPSSTNILTEKEHENGRQMVKHSHTSLQKVSSMQLMPNIKMNKESCKAGRGPEFSRNVFDIYGRSPLIEQYMRSSNMSLDGGVGIRVRRTEIDKLPSPSAPTYDDIIKETKRSSKRLEFEYRSSMEENAVERMKLSKRQAEIQNEMAKKTEELMANPNQVKKISDLLRLNLLRDQDNDFESTNKDVRTELSKILGYDVID